MKKVLFAVSLLVLSLMAGLLFAGEARPLMRYPDIHGNDIVFVHGGDIWMVSADGGVARRLTIDDGQEQMPKFSPDGSLIAFTAEYDGNGDVYVMNRDGGNITRVTWHPGFDRVCGWHPVNGKILFISGRSHFRFTKMYMINPDGTGLEEVIMHNIANGSFSPDGSKIAYNRVSRENRTWKRYKGGTAQEVYLYDLATDKEVNLTNFEGTDRFPMWGKDRIYFTSDRDRVLNIYSVDPAGGTITQLTHHTEYDARFPSMGGDRIVYEFGGSLRVYDTVSGRDRQVDVRINTDAPEARPAWVDVSRSIQEFAVSPDGGRALVVARGEVFSVPAEHGITRNLSAACGARDRDAVWSPDGNRIAFLSDREGEYQLYLTDPKGTSLKKLTGFKKGYPQNLRWSPDSKKIAFSDETLTLYYIDIDSGTITRVDKAAYEHVDIDLKDKPVYDHTWSPDSRYLAYSKMTADLVTRVFIYALDTKKTHCISGDLFNDFHPAFSPDGRHLFFVSNRRFDPTFCDFEWEMVYKKTSGIYAVTLQKDGAPLLPLQNDEAAAGKPEEDTGRPIRIDFDGIAGRIEALPLPRGNYRFLAAGENDLFYLNKDEGDFNRFKFRDIGPMDLYAFSFTSRSESQVIAGVNSYKLSADGSHIIYGKGRGIGIIASSARGASGSDISLADLKIFIDPKKEWLQIYNEAWRLERDFYYDPDMRGLDWPAIGEKYRRLLPYASCRQDLGYLIGELIGELNTSHTYVYGGDTRRTGTRVGIGLLGADYDIDAKANRYRFKKILRTPDFTAETWPPLAGPGKDVQEGDYLLQVNGREVTADRNIYSYFDNLAGEQVCLLINGKPTADGARKIFVETTGNEGQLRYRDWVEQNRLVVDKASGGKIGYLHMPDTYTGSAAEFPKYFFSQSQKEGLIIDGRFNGGGLDPVIFFQRLLRYPHSFWTRRYSHDQMSPFYGVRAHMACLTNRQAGSGGDELPEEFQQFKMGPVIGTRTWGGLVGVSMFMELMDGGGLTAPDYRIYTEDGRWTVENVGVTPDIEIDLHPAEMAKGRDAQLAKAIEVLMQKIKDEPRVWPNHPPIPKDIK
ncbi:PD40 domain-containing protein [bacterium]|nr:PD40 domain-containing protein [bacterium]